MKQRNLMILVGLGALAALAVGGGSAMAAKPEEGPGDGDGDGDDGDAVPELIDPPPPAPPADTTPPPASVGPVPNKGNEAMLNAFFEDTKGIARAFYILGYGSSVSSNTSKLNDSQANKTRLTFVKNFQRDYDKLAAAGRAGKSMPVFGPIPDALGGMTKRKNGDYDGLVGYETLAGLYNALRYFSPGSIWAMTTQRVQGDVAIGSRSDLTAAVNAL